MKGRFPAIELWRLSGVTRKTGPVVPAALAVAEGTVSVTFGQETTRRVATVSALSDIGEVSAESDACVSPLRRKLGAP